MPSPSPAPAGRPYEPPKIFRVRVAGDELAVAGCKTNVAVAGPAPPTCAKSICKNNGS
jgi:hypothetical protein